VSHTLRAVAETRLSKETWAAPEPHWVPLSRAVFHVWKDGKWALVGGVLLREWTEILSTKSGAQETEIDPTALSFSFRYHHDGAEWFVVAPWQFLGENGVSPTVSTLGLDIESSLRWAGRRRAVSEATNWMWRRLMFPSFDGAVSIGAAVLYGRPTTLTADFEDLPADVWPLLKVVDWQNGVAVAPDGSTYWSIHVHLSTAAIAITGAPPAPAELVLTRTHGPKPQKRKMVEEAMSRDILAKTLTLTELQQMLEKNLAERYGASRYTVRKARNAVVSKLSADSNSDK
jgi:hypothetical protein